MSRLTRALSLVLLLGSPAALAGAEVRIVNANGSGEGLNDRAGASPTGGNPGTTVGEQRLIAAQYAAALWSANLGNQVPISIRVSFGNLDCSGSSAVLGTAGPTALYDNDRYPAALANERAGKDLDPSQDEILAQFNSQVGSSGCAVTAWYTGLDNAGPTGTTDLPSVLLHELAHGLGFIRSVTAFRDQAKDGTTGFLLSELTGADLDAAVRRPMGLSWVGAAVRAEKDSILNRTDGVLHLPDGRLFPVARARFGPGHVSITARVVPALPADGGTSLDACGPLAPAPGALLLAERGLRADAGLVCFVSERALNAQAAGAVGLLVKPLTAGTSATSYSGDAGPNLTIPVWGISNDDGTSVEQLLPVAPTLTVDADGRRAGENLAGDVLLYTPSAYSEGSSVGHWDPSATPDLLMEPTINPHLSRDLDLTPAALQDVGWSPPTGLSIGATTLGADFGPGRPPRFIVQVINRGTVTATGVVLDAEPDSSVGLDGTALDCNGGFPCSLGDLPPGAVKTVLASTLFRGRVPRQVSVQFLLSGSPSPDDGHGTTTVVASQPSGCSSAGSGPGGLAALLAVAGWAVRGRRGRLDSGRGRE